LFDAGKQYWKDPNSFNRFSYPESGVCPSPQATPRKQNNITKYFTSPDPLTNFDNKQPVPTTNIFSQVNTELSHKASSKQLTLDKFGRVQSSMTQLNALDKVKNNR